MQSDEAARRAALWEALSCERSKLDAMLAEAHRAGASVQTPQILAQSQRVDALLVAWNALPPQGER
nr:hypothetical protein [Maliibacterium massiliense]